MNLSDIAKRMIRVVLVISLLCIIASIIYYRSAEFLPFLCGVILGSVVSIIKIYMIDRAIDKAMVMDKKKANNYMGLQNTLRLLLSGIVLVIGAVASNVSGWGVVAGIFAFPLATYSENFRVKTGGD